MADLASSSFAFPPAAGGAGVGAAPLANLSFGAASQSQMSAAAGMDASGAPAAAAGLGAASTSAEVGLGAARVIRNPQTALWRAGGPAVFATGAGTGGARVVTREEAEAFAVLTTEGALLDPNGGAVGELGVGAGLELRSGMTIVRGSSSDPFAADSSAPTSPSYPLFAGSSRPAASAAAAADPLANSERRSGSASSGGAVGIGGSGSPSFNAALGGTRAFAGGALPRGDGTPLGGGEGTTVEAKGDVSVNDQQQPTATATGATPISPSFSFCSRNASYAAAAEGGFATPPAPLSSAAAAAAAQPSFNLPRPTSAAPSAVVGGSGGGLGGGGAALAVPSSLAATPRSNAFHSCLSFTSAVSHYTAVNANANAAERHDAIHNTSSGGGGLGEAEEEAKAGPSTPTPEGAPAAANLNLNAAGEREAEVLSPSSPAHDRASASTCSPHGSAETPLTPSTATAVGAGAGTAGGCISVAEAPQTTRPNALVIDGGYKDAVNVDEEGAGWGSAAPSVVPFAVMGGGGSHAAAAVPSASMSAHSVADADGGVGGGGVGVCGGAHRFTTIQPISHAAIAKQAGRDVALDALLSSGRGSGGGGLSHGGPSPKALFDVGGGGPSVISGGGHNGSAAHPNNNSNSAADAPVAPDSNSSVVVFLGAQAVGAALPPVIHTVRGYGGGDWNADDASGFGPTRLVVSNTVGGVIGASQQRVAGGAGIGAGTAVGPESLLARHLRMTEAKRQQSLLDPFNRNAGEGGNGDSSGLSASAPIANDSGANSGVNGTPLPATAATAVPKRRTGAATASSGGAAAVKSRLPHYQQPLQRTDSPRRHGHMSHQNPNSFLASSSAASSAYGGAFGRSGSGGHQQYRHHNTSLSSAGGDGGWRSPAATPPPQQQRHGSPNKFSNSPANGRLQSPNGRQQSNNSAAFARPHATHLDRSESASRALLKVTSSPTRTMTAASAAEKEKGRVSPNRRGGVSSPSSQSPYRRATSSDRRPIAAAVGEGTDSHSAVLRGGVGGGALSPSAVPSLSRPGIVYDFSNNSTVGGVGQRASSLAMISSPIERPSHRLPSAPSAASPSPLPAGKGFTPAAAADDGDGWGTATADGYQQQQQQQKVFSVTAAAAERQTKARRIYLLEVIEVLGMKMRGEVACAGPSVTTEEDGGGGDSSAPLRLPLQPNAAKRALTAEELETAHAAFLEVYGGAEGTRRFYAWMAGGGRRC